MINHISIRDFAIIENTEIDFHSGLNILTGETGAGKSLVIEAVSLALGARADTAFIRSGCEKAVVQLTGDIDGEETVITREVSSSGKNLCRLNGDLVTLAQLNAYCRKLADIHGQYDHQSLLNPEYHINLVDIYHQNDIAPVKQMNAKLFSAYKDAKSKLESLMSSAAENARQRDFMAFELNEIEEAKLTEGEDAELEERIALLQNSEHIYKLLARAYEAGKESMPAAMDIMSEIQTALSDIASYTEELGSISFEFSDIFYRLDDIFRDIRNARDSIIFSQEELDEAILRLEYINKLKHKYGNTIAEILGYAEQTAAKLQTIENIDEEKANLEFEINTLETQLTAASERLTALRKASAEELEMKISKELSELNFTDSRIKIAFDALPAFTENGTDRIEFLISTNKGEPLKPLAKIASGGEMSRIMLAFKNIIADYDNIPTLIFDEIDAGISGITASIVGKKLKEIAENHQIICITHLPQIAAFGEHNYRIQKYSSENSVKTTVEALDENEKINEIARLLGGINITDITIKSAEELIAASK